MELAVVERIAEVAARRSKTASNYVAVQLMTYAGLRPGEVASMTVGDVLLGQGKLYIHSTATTDENHKAMTGDSPKSGRSRTIPLAPHLVPLLEDLTRGRKLDEPLFTTARGYALNMRNRRRDVWAPALKELGIAPTWVPKSVRKTTASLAMQSRGGPKSAQSMLGHSSLTITLDFYTAEEERLMQKTAKDLSKRRRKELKAAGLA